MPASHSRTGCVLVLLTTAFVVSCSFQAPDDGKARQVLYVWAGPHGTDSASVRAHDFLAVIDADSSSAAYGTLITSVDVGVPGAMAHHTEFVLPAGRPLFANDFTTGQTFLIDLAAPLKPRITHRIDSVPGFKHPHSFARLPNGNVLAILQFGNGSLAGIPEVLPSLIRRGCSSGRHPLPIRPFPEHAFGRMG